MARDESERLVAGRNRTRRALLFDQREQPPDLRPGRDAQLVAAQKRSGRVALARRAYRRNALDVAEKAKGIDGPGLRRTSEAVDRAGIMAGERLGAQQRPGHASQLAADRQLEQPGAQGRDEEQLRIRVFADVAEPGGAATEVLEEPELIEPGEACGAESLKLGENALTGGSGNSGRVFANQRLRMWLERQRQLILEPNGAQQPKRIVDEDGVGYRAEHSALEVVETAARIDLGARVDVLRNGVDGEIALGQVFLDRPAHRDEVDRGAAVDDNPPGAVARRELEDRLSGLVAKRPCGGLWLGARDIDVVDDAPEVEVSQAATHIEGVAPPDRAPDGDAQGVIHR